MPPTGWKETARAAGLQRCIVDDKRRGLRALSMWKRTILGQRVVLRVARHRHPSIYSIKKRATTSDMPATMYNMQIQQ
eukprot:scaffold181715_cov32-Tisochrysis_lutea.AAC.1